MTHNEKASRHQGIEAARPLRSSRLGACSNCVAILMMLSFVLPAGCTRWHIDPPPEDSAITFTGVSPPDDALAMAEFMLAAPMTFHYNLVAGDDEGETVSIVRRATNRHDANWADETEGVQTEYWRVSDEGHVVLTAVHDHEDDAVSHFDPPLIIGHRELPANEQQRQEVDMRIVRADNSDQQLSTGTAERTVEYIDRRTLRTPLGEFEAHRIVVRFEANMTFARAITSGTYYFAPGLGVIAETVRQEVRVLGSTTREKSHTRVLASVEGPDGMEGADFTSD